MVAARRAAVHVCGAMDPRLALLCVLGLAACSAAPRGSMRSSNVITREELESVQVSSAYDAVQRLRPQWISRPLAPTGQPGGNPVLVYVDRHQVGTLDELRHMTIDQIEVMEFVSAADATTRYGTGHTSGIVEVTSRRGR